MTMDQFSPVLLGTALAALIYGIGYSFLNGYFGYFNIFVGELDLSLQEIFVHAFSGIFSAISDHWFIPVIVFVSLLTAGVFIKRWEEGASDDWTLYVKNLVFWAVASFGCFALVMAQSNGQDFARESIPALNWSRPDAALTRVLEEVTGERPTRLYSIYNTSEVSYYLYIPREGRPPWTVRFDRENGIVDRYYLD